MKDEWISVKDRLPDKEKEYLIYPPHKYAGVAAIFWPYKDFREHRENTFELESEYGDISQITITHWMPLPEGPREDKK